MSAAPSGGVEAAADFARRFAEFWADPAPERLHAVLAERVKLVAPLTPTTHTLEEGRRVFSRLFRLVPDLRGRVHRWGATEDGVLIEFVLSGTAGGAPIAWRAVDRFVLGEDGLATERVTYFDPLPIALTLARRPRAWARLPRALISRGS